MLLCIDPSLNRSYPLLCDFDSYVEILANYMPRCWVLPSIDPIWNKRVKLSGIICSSLNFNWTRCHLKIAMPRVIRFLVDSRQCWWDSCRDSTWLRSRASWIWGNFVVFLCILSNHAGSSILLYPRLHSLLVGLSQGSCWLFYLLSFFWEYYCTYLLF